MARPLTEALGWCAITTAAIAAMAAVGRVVPPIEANIGVLVALLFLAVPHWVASRRGVELSVYGGTAAPLGRGLALGFGVPLIVFPLFVAGFVVFYDVVCGADVGGWLSHVAPAGLCRRWHGWRDVHMPALGWALAEGAFVQVVVVALPEELFFRGFIHRCCEQALPPRRRVLGGGIGWALVLSSALFAVGHLAVGLDPRRLAVFFPGLLFGWMRSATGSILAGTIAHAASNLLIDLLQKALL